MATQVSAVAAVARRRVPVGAVAGVAVAAGASLVPFIFLVVESLHPAQQGGGSLWGELFDSVPIGRYMLNSALIALCTTALVVTFSGMAGFGFGKLGYHGSSAAYGLVVAAISVPVASTILPNYLNFARVGGVGAYWGPIVMYTAGSLSFSTILMTSYFRSLPDELVESAVVDGASYVRIFRSIMVRMSLPALVTVGVLSFLGVWNDLLVALLFLPNPAMRTISVGVAALSGVHSVNLDLVLTGSLVSAIPPIVAFVVFQKYLVAGITSGISK